MSRETTLKSGEHDWSGLLVGLLHRYLPILTLGGRILPPDARQRSEELTGKVHLTQYDAVSSINPDLARRTLDAQRMP